jgi:hypothetical protein
MSFTGTPHMPMSREPEWGKLGHLCDGCNKECIFGIDYYMVKDIVWFIQAGLPARCLVCRDCLQIRLGRRLVREDFTEAPVNHFLLALLDKSPEKALGYFQSFIALTVAREQRARESRT